MEQLSPVIDRRYEHAHDYTRIADTRNDDYPPSYYSQGPDNKKAGYELKEGSVLGFTIAETGNRYVTLQTLRQWPDQSGGSNTQFAYCHNGKVFQRKSVDENTWGDWVEFGANGSSSAEPIEPVELSRNALLALETNSQLVPGQIYIANDIDWVLAGGTGKFSVTPTATNKLPSMGLYLAGAFEQASWWEGDIDWSSGRIIQLHDSDRENRVYGILTTRSFPFNNDQVFGNDIRDATISISDAAEFSRNSVMRGHVNLSGNAKMQQNHCEGSFNQVHATGGEIIDNRFNSSYINMTGIGSIVDSEFNECELRLTTLQVEQINLLPDCNIRAEGAIGTISRTQFSNTTTFDIRNIPSIAIDTCDFSDCTIDCDGATSLNLQGSSFKSNTRVQVSNGNELQTTDCNLYSSATVIVSSGKLVLWETEISTRGIIGQYTEFTNNVYNSKLQSGAQVYFQDTSENNRLLGCTIDDRGVLRFSGSSTNCRVDGTTCSNASYIDVIDSIGCSISLCSVISNSRLRVTDTVDTNYIRNCTASSYGQLTATGSLKNSTLHVISVNSGAVANAVDHAGQSHSHQITSRYKLEIGTNAGVFCRSMFAAGEGSGSVNRTFTTTGSVTKNF